MIYNFFLVFKTQQIQHVEAILDTGRKVEIRGESIISKLPWTDWMNKLPAVIKVIHQWRLY